MRLKKTKKNVTLTCVFKKKNKRNLTLVLKKYIYKCVFQLNFLKKFQHKHKIELRFLKIRHKNMFLSAKNYHFF